jgi:hypothetical protein
MPDTDRFPVTFPFSLGGLRGGEIQTDGDDSGALHDSEPRIVNNERRPV